MISSVLEADNPRAMRRVLFVFIVLAVCVHVECRSPRTKCKHKVRTPTKCHTQNTCSPYARLTPSQNSTLFYCCKEGYRSKDNECVDIDECAAEPKPCPSICHNHPGTFSCGCDKGFYFVDQTKSCVEATSCTHLNCSNHCFFDAQGPVCDCPQGFKLVGNTNCTAEEKVCPSGYHKEFNSQTCRVMGDKPQMILELSGQVYGYSLHEEDKTMRKLVRVEGVVNSIYYDSKARTAYLAGDYITAINLTNSLTTKRNLSSLAIGMAVDYVNRHIYVLDDRSLSLWSIKAGELTSLGTLIENDGSITAIAIDPGNAWLLYAKKGFVVRATLDGRKFSDTFNFYTHVPDEDVATEVLAVDTTDLNELFFFYGVNRNIFSFTVDGRRLLWVTDSLPGNVVFMDVFEDFLYYTMEGVDGITSRTKDGLKAPVVYFSGQFFRTIYVNHPQRQVESIIWHCEKVCAQLCFRDSLSRSVCACAKDYSLGQDMSSCIPVNDTVPDEYSRPGIPSPQIGEVAWEDSESSGVTTTTTVSLYNGLLLVGCVLLLSVCVVQSLLMWWFYPRRRYQQGMGVSFAARYHDSSSCVALDSVRDIAEN